MHQWRTKSGGKEREEEGGREEKDGRERKEGPVKSVKHKANKILQLVRR